jgi:hypothetical protein
MTTLTPIETRRAGHGEGSCPACRHDLASGQRIALVRTGDAGHAWIHLRCCLAETSPGDANAVTTGDRQLTARPLAVRVRKARRTGWCTACRQLVHIGQQVALVPGQGWIHAACATRRSQEPQPEGITT